MTIIKSMFLSFTIWVLAAMLNTVLSGTWLTFFSDEFKYRAETFLMVLFFSLVFSIPGIFVFWIVLLTNWSQDHLFRLLLKTGFIISALSSLMLYLLPLSVVKGQHFFLSVCIVIASIASIMLHHRRIKSIA